MRYCLPAVALLTALLVSVGCGTTKWSDTGRTATEQLLISDAMDRSVSKLDLCAIAGKTVYLDTSPLQGVVDAVYLASLIRQHMLASGCILKENREEADYVLEVRAGTVGTDREDVLFGVPATKVPSVVPIPGAATDVPEIPLARKTQQRAVVKIALFAYNRKTGRPVWQSGAVPVESNIKNISVLGAGPFERGTIVKGTKFAGNKLKLPLVNPQGNDKRSLVSVSDEAYFAEPKEPAASDGVVRAGHTEPAAPPPTQSPQDPSPPPADSPPPPADSPPPATAAPAFPFDDEAPAAPGPPPQMLQESHDPPRLLPFAE